MKKLTSKAYNAVYRLRKKECGLLINTRQRTIFYDITNPELLDIRASKKLLNEFHFAAQSELK